MNPVSGNQDELIVKTESEVFTNCSNLLYSIITNEFICIPPLLLQNFTFLMGYKEEVHDKIHIIMDGSSALQSACEQLGCVAKRCMVHIFRMPDKKLGKKGYSGTAGSLYVFLKLIGKGKGDFF